MRRAAGERIRLRSFVEYQGLIDFRGYLGQQARTLAQNPDYRPDLYVEQRMRYVLNQRENEVEDAISVVHDWIFEDRGRFILVLGDFGTGKTFLLRELARRLGAEGGRVVPIFVELRALEKSQSLDVLVGQHFMNAGMDPRRDAFRYMLEQGRVVLLFDGFDELALRVSYDRAVDHFATLAEAARASSKVVVTSRTQHFETDEQIQTVLGEQAALLPGSRITYLQKFDEKQIRRFLVNQLDDETAAEERFNLLDEVKDLMGLSENPRMLSFISELSNDELSKARTDGGDVTAAGLYEALVNRWLGFEVKRQEPLGAPLALTAEQRWAAVTHLATCLWERTEKSVHVRELDEEVQRAVEVLADQRLSPDETTHQVGSATLLVRDDEGMFSFVHQSVLEWLVARQAAAEVKASGSAEVLAMREMSDLMADFFCDLAGRDPALGWATHALRSGDEVSGKNALTIVKRLGEILPKKLKFRSEDLRGHDFSGQMLANADFSFADLSRAKLVEASLRHACLQSANFLGADLTKADLRRADLRDADLSEARLLGADLTDADLRATRFIAAKLVGAKADLSGLQEMQLTGSAPPQPTAATPQSSSSWEGYAVDWNPDQDLLAAGYNNGSVQLWDATLGHEIRRLEGNSSAAIRGVCFTPDGSLLASASEDHKVHLWSTESGEKIHQLRGHRAAVRDVNFSPHGDVLASASHDHTLHLWSVESGREVRKFVGHSDWIRSVRFSPDAELLASGSFDRTVRLWSVASGESWELIGHQRPVLSVCFHPDGSVLASGSDDTTIRLWSVKSSKEILKLAGHNSYVRSVLFSPDSTLLATGSRDRTICLWSGPSWEHKRQLLGHQSDVWSLCFSPDGSSLASASEDGTVRIWDVKSGACLVVLVHLAEGWVAFTEDGRYKLGGETSGGFWHTIGLCRFEPGELEPYLPLRMAEGEKFF